MNSYNTTNSLWRHFDKPVFVESKYLRIVIEKAINGTSYSFVSPVLNKDKDALKMSIEFNQNSYVFYHPINPTEYYFEIA